MQDIKRKSKTTTFKAFSHPHYKKGLLWYVLVGLVCVVLVGLFVYLGEYLGGLALLVAGVVFVIYSRMAPKKIACTVSKEGVKIGERFYPRKQLKGFWIVERPQQSILYLESARSMRFIYFGRLTHVFLKKQPIEPIKKALSGYLPERLASELLIDKIVRWLKI